MIQDTSTRAHRLEVAPTLGPRQAAVRRLLMAYPDGLTNAEMAKLLDWPINTLTPRTFELVHMTDENGRPNPVVEDAGIRKCNATGRQAHAWKLTYTQLPKVATNQLSLTWKK